MGRKGKKSASKPKEEEFSSSVVTSSGDNKTEHGRRKISGEPQATGSGDFESKGTHIEGKANKAPTGKKTDPQFGSGPSVQPTKSSKKGKEKGSKAKLEKEVKLEEIPEDVLQFNKQKTAEVVATSHTVIHTETKEEKNEDSAAGFQQEDDNESGEWIKQGKKKKKGKQKQVLKVSTLEDLPRALQKLEVADNTFRSVPSSTAVPEALTTQKRPVQQKLPYVKKEAPQQKPVLEMKQEEDDFTMASSKKKRSKQRVNIQALEIDHSPILYPDLSARMPMRKTICSLGRPLTIETNHMALTLKKKLDIAIHYDVAIKPDKPRKLFPRIWHAFRRKYLPNCNVAFDDMKNAYSPGFLPFGEYCDGSVEISEDQNSKPKIYTVTIKFAAKVNLNTIHEYLQNKGRISLPQDALQCLDIVLRNAVTSQFVRVGRSYFSQPRERIELSSGLELWYGFYQSVNLGWKPFLNMDVVHKGFPTAQNVVELIAELQHISVNHVQAPDEKQKRELMRIIKNLKVLYEIPGQPASKRSYRVIDIEQTPDRANFEDNGHNVTVLQYFAMNKNYKLKYPFLPCLRVGPVQARILLPPELCTIMKGQVINKKMNDRQTSNTIRNAASSTGARKKKILDSLIGVNYNDDPCVAAFGFSVSNTFEKVPARVLPPPRLEYLNQREVVPSKGFWRAGIFHQAAKLTHWTILNLSKVVVEKQLEDFVFLIKRTGKEVGMEISEPVRPLESVEPINKAILEKYFSRYVNNIQLIFVIFADSGEIYSRIKQVAELTVGCLTQCVREKTVSKMTNMTAHNILLKVNAKLNGRNHVISTISRPPCLNRPCMIMGADVTHPSPDQTNIPSVAAVCASLDAKAFSYNFCWRLQPPCQEIISDLDDIVKEQLLMFYRKTLQKPERIIFFRDGVSEGQFPQVLNAEVHAIRRACSLVQSDYKPKVTFLVVQKRHHTRFFPTNPKDSEDKNMNVPAGTLVDTNIVHPSAVEYYLVSHASIQGVARPTKYRVLWDDADMSQNEIQELTYALCHMFSRCTRSVSYPAPTYYSHLAAFRARVYLEGKPISMEKLAWEQTERQIKEALSPNMPMFFV